MSEHESKSVTIKLPATKWFYTTVILVIMLGGSLYYNFNPSVENGEAAPTPTPTATPSIVDVSVDDDAQLGPSNAKVTIVEFANYQCGYCARAADTVEQIVEEYGNDVRIIFRDFPFPGQETAQKAAQASECAHEQGKYWEYHNILFENIATLDDETMKQFAADLGLDTAQFNDCLDSGKYADEVQNDYDDGQSYGVTGTPTFFIGTGTTTITAEKVVGAQPFSAFKAVIDEKLA